MKYATHEDLVLILHDLTVAKLSMLDLTATFRIYKAKLIAKHEAGVQIIALVKGRPHAGTLQDADKLYDAIGYAIYDICNGLERLPLLDQVTRDLAAKVRDSFVPSPSVLTLSYEDEASRSKGLEARYAELKDEMAKLQVTPQHNLEQLVRAFLDAGHKINELLGSRAGTGVDTTTLKVRAMRSEAIALIGRFRQALTDEVEADKTLPRDLVTRVFALADQTEADRAIRFKKSLASATPTGEGALSGSTPVSEPETPPHA